ncbi:hypothetical protein D9758_009193 [Tetrapyrgos nigripes]|uniref:Integrase catalytic domain-containing protein n=1 Tax=Tetrapyrgos nigripes TaxID=182062 RepID=A0A8H5D1W4_9AGAR|nr:hypothetical protein D9758_009193 [Tetrapyrgos nigripes]
MNAREFLGAELTKWLQDREIVSIMMVAYAHQQNGKIERMMAITMLTESGSPMQFWEYVVDMSVYILHHLPTSVGPDDVTPYEGMFGMKPDVSNMHVPFCCCWFLIPEEICPKKDTKGKEHFSQDMKFDKHTFGKLKGVPCTPQPLIVDVDSIPLNTVSKEPVDTNSPPTPHVTPATSTPTPSPPLHDNNTLPIVKDFMPPLPPDPVPTDKPTSLPCKTHSQTRTEVGKAWVAEWDRREAI